MKIQVLLPAGRIPEHSIVMKETGTIPYTLLRQITVYGGDKKPVEINADGVSYIVGVNGVHINAINDNRILKWCCEEKELYEYLKESLEIEDVY